MAETRTLAIRMIRAYGDTKLRLFILAETPRGEVESLETFSGEFMRMITFVDAPSELVQEKNSGFIGGWKTTAIRLNRANPGV